MVQSLWTADRVPGDVELAVWRAGSGPDPLLCLHGITAQHRAFNALAGRLASSRGLVGVDLRGRGDSGKPGSGYGLQTHASDAIRVLDHLGLRKAVFVGHSMGGFVALKAALSYPQRVRAIVLLDSGWPRPEGSPDDASGGGGREGAIDEGLARAFRRLDMTFESPEAYLDFWFPGQNLTLDDLPADLADYYLYDLEVVEGRYKPKASRAAAEQDALSSSSSGPTADEMRGVACPVALVRASEGFFPGSDPLLTDETRDVMASVLDLRSDTVVEGANHYSMLWPEYVPQWADILIDDAWCRQSGAPPA